VGDRAFRELNAGQSLLGCGAHNPGGLHLKSYRDGDVAIAQWTPSGEFAAGPRHFLNGGIIVTPLKCHGVCTAVADAYQRESHEIGTDPEIRLATTSLSVEYLRPTSITQMVRLTARVTGRDGG
jgi:hypothetical protein